MKKNLVFAFLVFSMVFISCDQDFNTVGADLVGNEHFDFDKEEISGLDLKAYTKSTGDVQTNNLPINPLGFYNNPYFGLNKANFVTQVALSIDQPKFGTAIEVENVTLYIPYFNTLKVLNADGSKTYDLDSIYSFDVASKVSKMKLNVYENGFYLNSFDAVDQTLNAKYYSDMNSVIEAQKKGSDVSGNSFLGGERLNNSITNIAENDEFFFNKEEIIVYKTKLVGGVLLFVDANNVELANQTDVALRVVKERLAPGIYLTLNKAFFKKKILEASSEKLFNNNVFREYFKGLYFEMEQVAGQHGAMAMINFAGGKIDINYSSVSDGAAVGAAATSKTYSLGLGTNRAGNTVSLHENAFNTAFNTGITTSNEITGQNNQLFLKGGKGSVVYLEISEAKIAELKAKNYLINDAFIEFYVDNAEMAINSSTQEAERLYLFDATNQKPLVDYVFDASTTTNTKNNKYLHGGILERNETTKKGIKYKIRITQHINNILNSTNENVNKNVKLGLCVTENINIANNYFYKNAQTFISPNPNITYFPVSSILSQQGTVLHGTSSLDADKKLKLTIYYTKPN